MFKFLKRLFHKKNKEMPLVAILVGHSRLVNGKPEGGAVSVGGVSEHAYNVDMAHRMQKTLGSMGVRSIILTWYEGHSYSSAVRWLSSEVQKMKARCAVELHFNAAGPQAHGHEWLYWHESDDSMKLAYAVNVEFVREFPELRQRGIKPVRSKDRGALMLQKMPCPTVIAEPFFGSNHDEWQAATTRKDDMATAMCRGIAKFLR